MAERRCFVLFFFSFCSSCKCCQVDSLSLSFSLTLSPLPPLSLSSTGHGIIWKVSFHFEISFTYREHRSHQLHPGFVITRLCDYIAALRKPQAPVWKDIAKQIRPICWIHRLSRVFCLFVLLLFCCCCCCCCFFFLGGYVAIHRCVSINISSSFFCFFCCCFVFNSCLQGMKLY